MNVVQPHAAALTSRPKPAHSPLTRFEEFDRAPPRKKRNIVLSEAGRGASGIGVSRTGTGRRQNAEIGHNQPSEARKSVHCRHTEVV